MIAHFNSVSKEAKERGGEEGMEGRLEVVKAKNLAESSPSLVRGLCAVFASNSQWMRLFQATLNTCVSTAPSLPASQFTVCTSRF